MLVEIDSALYRHYFRVDPHPFISEDFIELNRYKTERVLRLVDDGEKKELGLIAGIKDNRLISPFSAPFGGVHFRSEIIYISELDNFINLIKEYILLNGFSGIELTLPPDIYNQSFNAKMVNSLIRNNFQMSIPDLTGWVNLQSYQGVFSKRNSREYYRQALRNGLNFESASEEAERQLIYEVIRENRMKFGRPIHMSFDDLMRSNRIWPVDFFRVTTESGVVAASAIFYRNHPEISYAVFWGDSETGRPLRAMDFLIHNLWIHYKDMGYKYIDLGISTENGIPNEGLLRFKESHDAVSSIKYRFKWVVIDN